MTKTINDIKREVFMNAEAGVDISPEAASYAVDYLHAKGLLMVWRDMDSAPRDGTWLLAYDGFWCVVCWSEEAHCWEADGYFMDSGFKPTAWMPLPRADGGWE